MAAKPLIYQFLDVRVEVASFRVSKAGRPLVLEPKAIETLIFLLERRGRLVEKDELLNGVWRDSFVTPNALTRIIAQLRRELGDDPKEARIIETVPTRGYRFITEVKQWEETVPSSFINSDAQVPRFIETGSVSVYQPVASTLTEEEDVYFSAEASLAGDKESGKEVPSDVSLPKAKSRKRSIARYFWLAAAIVLLIVSAVTVYQRRTIEDREPVTSYKTPAIAILPFKQLTTTDGGEYLGTGLA